MQTKLKRHGQDTRRNLLGYKMVNVKTKFLNLDTGETMIQGDILLAMERIN